MSLLRLSDRGKLLPTESHFVVALLDRRQRCRPRTTSLGPHGVCCRGDDLRRGQRLSTRFRNGRISTVFQMPALLNRSSSLNFCTTSMESDSYRKKLPIIVWLSEARTGPETRVFTGDVAR